MGKSGKRVRDLSLSFTHTHIHFLNKHFFGQWIDTLWFPVVYNLWSLWQGRAGADGARGMPGESGSKVQEIFSPTYKPYYAFTDSVVPLYSTVAWLFYLVFFTGWQGFWWASRSARWKGTQGEYEHIQNNAIDKYSKIRVNDQGCIEGVVKVDEEVHNHFPAFTHFCIIS